MTEVLLNGNLVFHRRQSSSNEQLPTPLPKPLLPSPSLGAFAPSEHVLYENQEEERTDSPLAPTEPAGVDATGADKLNGSAAKRDVEKQAPLGPNGHHVDGKGNAAATIEVLEVPGEGTRRRRPTLSPEQLKELTLDPSSIPVRLVTPSPKLEEPPHSAPPQPIQMNGGPRRRQDSSHGSAEEGLEIRGRVQPSNGKRNRSLQVTSMKEAVREDRGKENAPALLVLQQRPGMPARTVSTPPNIRRKHSRRQSVTAGRVFDRGTAIPAKLDVKSTKDLRIEQPNGHLKLSNGPRVEVDSPIMPSLPLPPMSMPTILQLELDSQEPSPLYIHREPGSDLPYEPSAVKFERLENFLKLPGYLEGTLLFGAAACFDSWLHAMTILPLRFLKALAILGKWWVRNLWKEIRDISDYVYSGLGRLWRRRRKGSVAPPALTRSKSQSRSRSSSKVAERLQPNKDSRGDDHGLPRPHPESPRRLTKSGARRHRRTRSTPSLLSSTHKADLLKGFLILGSCIFLMQLDPSRMYHNIRGQAAIKLYVIYNMLEVADRLLGSIGQDILECLFSRETLDRKPDGRSKVLRPFGLFILSLIYNVIHASTLFYQVITLNVAVNSYSNALLTLLMSNQFVEIKGAVFKKFEKENLFQMCCADVVERFQLLLMLLIIAMRNIVEMGGLSVSPTNNVFTPPSATAENIANATGTPMSSSTILPKSFDILPRFPGKVLAPFLIVIGSEMLVDWLKYAYINKFNNYKPHIFGRFYDVLARDYYTNAFADQNLTRRIGLPIFPLTCLFIRASGQTYQMLIATYMPPPIPATTTGVSDPSTTPAAPLTIVTRTHQLLRNALGRSSAFERAATLLRSTDLTVLATTLILCLAIYLLLLAFKLVWGMFLLSISRRRCLRAKLREQRRALDLRDPSLRAAAEESVDAEGKRVGGWGTVELTENTRRCIYDDDPEGWARIRKRDEKAARERSAGGEVDYGRVRRYDMVAKRIW